MDHSRLVSFGPFTFDRARMVLHREGQTIPVGGRGAAILAALADAGGNVVTRGELLDAAWPGHVVEERNLTVQIALLRKAMGDLPEDRSPIRTVSRVGYRLLREDPDPRTRSILALRPSVVVLPFANLSPDPDLAFFADGVTEDIIAALSRLHTFAVVARGTSFAYKGRTVPATEAAAVLGVRYVLEGSVRRASGRLRIAASLTDASGILLWADSFEEELDGVFDLQDRVTATVVSLAEPRITQAELDRSRRKHPQSLDAYDHFLQGTAHFGHLDASAPAYDRMVAHLDCAVRLDPTFPQALVGAAKAHNLRRTFGAASPLGVDDFAIGNELTGRALALAPNDSLVLSCAASNAHNYQDDGEGGLAFAERAVALNPHHHAVLHNAGTIQRQRSRADSAMALFEHCLRLSPHSPMNAMTVENIGCCHLDVGRYEEAAHWISRAVAMGASWDLALVNLTVAHAMSGQKEEARSALGRVLAVRPGLTIRALMDRLPAGTRGSVEHIWPEGLRRAGLPTG